MIKRILAYISRLLPQIEEEPSYIVNTSKDKEDIRDLNYTSTSPVLPNTYVIPNLPPIRHQGTIGSCASHAVIGCYEIQLPKDKFLQGSELFHYYNARKYINKTYPDDKGMTIREACKTLKNYGFAFEFLWPYIVRKFNATPTKMPYFFSKLYKVEKYEKLLSLNTVKESIIKDIPVSCGICVNQNFYKLNQGDYLYKPARKTLYGHAIIIVGYNDDTEVLMVRNSWGKSWGNMGYFEMPYKNFKATSFDWWRILIKGGK